MRAANWIPILAVCLLAVGCAFTNYSVFEGGDVIEGTGGTKKTVDGIDIWNNGTPPRKYKVIGIIDDVRRESLIGMAGYESRLVKKAKEASGDAIVFLDSHSELVGYHTSGDAGMAYSAGGQPTYQSADSTTTAIHNKVTKAAVIKYVE